MNFIFALPPVSFSLFCLPSVLCVPCLAFAFIVFEDAASAESALHNSKELILRKRRLRVEPFASKSDDNVVASSSSSSSYSCSLDAGAATFSSSASSAPSSSSCSLSSFSLTSSSFGSASSRSRPHSPHSSRSRSRSRSRSSSSSPSRSHSPRPGRHTSSRSLHPPLSSSSSHSSHFDRCDCGATLDRNAPDCVWRRHSSGLRHQAWLAEEDRTRKSSWTFPSKWKCNERRRGTRWLSRQLIVALYRHLREECSQRAKMRLAALTDWWNREQDEESRATLTHWQIG